MESQIFVESPSLDNAIVESRRWADEDWVHSQFAWLRENSPIRKMSPNGFEPFWCITRHADIRTIESDKKLFINDPRPILTPRMFDAVVQQLTGRRHLVRSLVTMDDPDHNRYRALTQQWFSRTNLVALTERIDQLAREYVDRLAEFGGECDFVKDVAIWYPLRVIMSILGIPEQDEPFMMKLTQELFGGSDPDTRRSFESSALMDVISDFESYFEELTRNRRANPTDDVASLVANAKIDDKPVPDRETNGYYNIIATAGHDTTSSSVSGGLLALMEHPNEMEKLRRDPDQYMPSAINEVVRWVSPVRQFMRTATADCKVAGADIAAGEACVLWFLSANRDAAVFDEPFAFRVDRSGMKHLGFGFGAHTCLGQHLARMEMSALFRELLRRVDHVELNGEPRYSQSTFVGGLKSLPIRYRMR
ncbi:MAG: cytochrome P450 [Gammaproteobacteria bacterium]|nr:cytochrome P450 [Gammaproteobacteria bacterium]